MTQEVFEKAEDRARATRTSSVSGVFPFKGLLRSSGCLTMTGLGSGARDADR